MLGPPVASADGGRPAARAERRASAKRRWRGQLSAGAGNAQLLLAPESSRPEKVLLVGGACAERNQLGTRFLVPVAIVHGTVSLSSCARGADWMETLFGALLLV